MISGANSELRNEDYAAIDDFIRSQGWSKADYIKKAYEIMRKNETRSY